MGCMAAGAAGEALGPLAGDVTPSSEYLKMCPFNAHAGMVNLSALPDCLYHHAKDEILAMNINWGTMFDRNSPDLVSHGSKRGDLWQYGPGIKEALARGQNVFLVLDFPWDMETNSTSLEEWTRYVTTLAKEYKRALFVMDNELDAPEKKYWRDRPWQYASYYLAAAKVLRSNPFNSIIFPAESYRGDGTITRKMLAAISEQVYKEPALQTSRLIDGLAVHSFVRASSIRERIRLFQGISVPVKHTLQLHIRELGKTEGAILSPEEQEWAVVQGMATALSLVPRDVFSAIWHAAFVPTAADPAKHSLTYVDAKGNLQKYPALDAFWQICRLLYSVSSYEEKNGITIVTGKTSMGNETTIAWNNLLTPGRSVARYYRGRDLWSSPNPAVEGKPEFFFEKFYPSRRNLPWWFEPH